MARPPKYTPERERIILETVAAGGTFRAACLRAGISEETLARWRRRYVDFAERLKKAEGDAITRNLAIINRAAAEGTWQAAAWWLERRYPEEYGRQYLDSRHTGEIKLTVVRFGEDDQGAGQRAEGD